MSKVKNVETTCASTTEGSTTIKQKRGRKSKKDLQNINKENAIEKNIELENISDNITCVITDTNDFLVDTIIDNTNLENDIDNDNDIDIDTIKNEEQLKSVAKKRGRKPKGGKIIQQSLTNNNNKETKPNIILHLKCSLKELQTNNTDNNVESFNFSSCKNELNYEVIDSTDIQLNQINQSNFINETSNSFNTNTSIINNYYDEDNNYEKENYSNKEFDIKDVWKKLKILEHNLHINNISDKKSACFWCTYEFDNPPIYIPKHYIKESYHVYGCFCSPECATAHLMEENIDSSSKFERYHLINHIYSKIYNYTKNIKPAPNPYYMLDKYYGNLNIQEYRALLRNERLFLVVDKPLTRILPELHEDNDDFIINNKIIPSNTYQVKKKIQKKNQSKNNILNEKFGIS